MHQESKSMIDTMKLLKENFKKTLQDVSVSGDFLEMTPEAKAITQLIED